VTLRAEVDALPWFHEIKAEVLALEANSYFKDGVEGLTVLDVGCWDGFNSFEARRRGAERVLATDHYVWAAGLAQAARPPSSRSPSSGVTPTQRATSDQPR
jgi:tRNA (mo5U34)-methyltransferase